MSGGVKMVLSLIVLALIAVGGWYFYTHQSPKVVENTTPTATTTTTTQTQEQTPPPSLITSADTSDASLVSDMAAVDAQLSVLGKDSSDVDASMNDKQVTQ